MNKLAGKVVLITGASSGLGEQMAYESARQGASLILCARRSDRLKDVSDKCRELTQAEVSYYLLDLANPENIEEISTQIARDHTKIDILVNNAGFGLFELFSVIEQKTIEEMFQVNVLGLMAFTRNIMKNMGKNNKGHIINIASQGGKMATAKSTIYSATKAAVIAFSNALRLELVKKNIQVTTVNPGPIKTDFFDQADPTGNYLQSVEGISLDSVILSKKIVNAFGKKKREINAPFIMEVASKMYTLFPSIGDILSLSLFNKK